MAVENEVNNRPRRVLNDRVPAELFAALLASENPSVLRGSLQPASPRCDQYSVAVDRRKAVSFQRRMAVEALSGVGRACRPGARAGCRAARIVIHLGETSSEKGSVPVP